MWLKRLIRRVKMFFRNPPSFFLECEFQGERACHHVYGSAGFSLKGFNADGDRVIRKQDAVDPKHWQRIWDHLNPDAVLTWVSEQDDSVRSDHARIGGR